ncbi:MAG: SDR family NAD(P)-dependent oxidoreductase [Saprospiraceae bacterium]|nr:SDR family NAD(P)-dependent oxidoreductase [Saprospiraceae bacterium]
MGQKYVFITGVSTGIGYGLMKFLISENYFVIGSVRKIEDAEKLQSEFKGTCSILIFDVQDSEKMKSEIDRIFQKLEIKQLYALINNAGVAFPGPLQYLSEEDFEKQLDINVKSVRRVTNYLLPYLGVGKVKSENPGRIVNISSVSGKFNSPYNGAYCISKHALESMNDIYRRELAEFGIKVISILPGPVKTEIWKKNLNVMSPYLETEYGETLKHADKLIQNAEKSALDVSDVEKVVHKALELKNPSTRYLVHRKKLLFRILSTLIPDKWADRMVKNALSGGEKYRPV